MATMDSVPLDELDDLLRDLEGQSQSQSGRPPCVQASDAFFGLPLTTSDALINSVIHAEQPNTADLSRSPLQSSNTPATSASKTPTHGQDCHPPSAPHLDQLHHAIIATLLDMDANRASPLKDPSAPSLDGQVTTGTAEMASGRSGSEGVPTAVKTKEGEVEKELAVAYSPVSSDGGQADVSDRDEGLLSSVESTRPATPQSSVVVVEGDSLGPGDEDSMGSLHLSVSTPSPAPLDEEKEEKPTVFPHFGRKGRKILRSPSVDAPVGGVS